MMRLEDKFKSLKLKGKKAFISYVPFGFPNPNITKDILLTLQLAGADIIELGIPFSDPLADGPIIQKASVTALENDATIERFFLELEQIKDKLKIPVVIMSYYNPIFKFGMNKFFKKISCLGIKAITIVDLPLEESQEYILCAKKYDLDTIFFITPTTTEKRIKSIAAACSGFVYYISVTGITGPKSLKYASLRQHIRKIKKATNTPVCVGFGIHKKDQIEKINKFSDGVIVGSEIVSFIENNHKHSDFLNRLKNHIQTLIG